MLVSCARQLQSMLGSSCGAQVVVEIMHSNPRQESGTCGRYLFFPVLCFISEVVGLAQAQPAMRLRSKRSGGMLFRSRTVFA